MKIFVNINYQDKRNTVFDNRSNGKYRKRRL